MKNQVQQSKPYLAKAKNENHKCPNCGNLYSGNFCSNCGQSVEEVNKPFKDFLIDLLGTVSAFDFRFWRTVKQMFIHPHKLSENYLKGKRARYMPPFKFYFFVSFIFFFIVNWLTDSNLNDNTSNLISKNNSEFTFSSNVNDSTQTNSHLNDTISLDSIYNLFDSRKLEENELVDSTSTNTIHDPITEKDKLKEIILNKESRRLFIGKIYKNISWMIIILMPIYAILLQLLYLKQKSYYVRHLVFAINSHSLVFIILILFFILNHFLDNLKVEFHNYLLLLPPIYMILSMKKFYKQTWSKTIVKFFILTTLYNFVLLAALVIVFVITFGTY